VFARAGKQISNFPMLGNLDVESASQPTGSQMCTKYFEQPKESDAERGL